MWSTILWLMLTTTMTVSIATTSMTPPITKDHQEIDTVVREVMEGDHTKTRLITVTKHHTTVTTLRGTTRKSFLSSQSIENLITLLVDMKLTISTCTNKK